ncbi:MAG TPA: ZIP family metal transporter [bacterium]|nr:ZIP family metal transporter [bacterium]
MTLFYILAFSFLGGAGSVGLAALALLIPRFTAARFVSVFVSYATGALLGAAFIGLIPHALHELGAGALFPTVIAGIVAFFILEKLLIWRHCHEANCPEHKTAGPLIIFGDALHNFVDGVIIAAAFLTSIELGIATAVAVIAHELPQELGDFMILLESGYSRARALAYNLLSSFTTFAGGLLAYFFLKELSQAVPYVMAVSAASFIYIALADLIPGRRKHASLSQTAIQTILMLLGIGTIALFHLHAH